MVGSVAVGCSWRGSLWASAQSYRPPVRRGDKGVTGVDWGVTGVDWGVTGVFYE